MGKGDHVLHVGLGNFLTHTMLRGINDALGDTLIVLHKGSDIVEMLVVQFCLVLDKQSKLGVPLVVRHNLDKFREMPRVPFSNTHRECVDRLVELIEDGNSLDDVVVVTLHGELDLGTRVSVTKTKLGSVHVSLTKLLQHFRGMQSKPTKHVLDNLAGVTSLAFNESECGLDTSSKSLIRKTKNNLILLLWFRKIQLEKGNERVRCDSFRNIVDFAQSLLVVSGFL